MNEQQSFGVYQKIAEVMKRVGSVGKDAKHGQGFRYQSAEQVSSSLRGHMADVGLILLSECVASDDTGSQWICDYRFTFIDVEDGSNHSLAWQQATPHKDGKDDKAMGKNHTYAQKYFLLRTFMVSSKDDVDADTNDFQGEQAFKPKKKQSAPRQQTTNGNGKKANWLKNDIAVQEIKQALADYALNFDEDAIQSARDIVDKNMAEFPTHKAYLEALSTQLQKAG